MITKQKFAPVRNLAKTNSLLWCMGLLALSSAASGNETMFGTNHDGLGGFATGSTITAPAWTTETDSARFTNDATETLGFANSSLLKEFILSRADGSICTVTGVLHVESTYAADNNRFGILLFGTSDDLAGADTGLSLQHNVGNGQFRILAAGVNGTGGLLNVNASYLGLNGADAIGTTFTYRADVAFVGTDIQVDFTLTDQNDFSQTVSATVAAVDYPGTFFGFATRGRVRSTVPGTNDLPFIYDAKTFSVVDVPPPASAPPTLVITPNTTTPGHYDFSWNSQAGKVYDLVSSPDLSTTIGTWPVWDGQSDLPATPPNNMLSDIPGGGAQRRFFALAVRDAPPLFSENFDSAAALPSGWTSNGPSNGTDWEVGVPSGVASGPVTAFSGANCAGTNIGGYYTANVNVSLVSPAIAIPADRGATLVFRQLIDTDFAGDAGAVLVLDADNADTPIAGLAITGLQGIGSLGPGWTENTLAMPALDVGGKNIKIAFEFISDAGTVQGTDVFGGFYVDDMAISLD